jgi:4-oxalocrotonate tautomerase
VPIVTVEWYEGRSADQKREIAEKITDAVSDIGKTPREDVWIKFVDLAKSEWSIGGQMQG